ASLGRHPHSQKNLLDVSTNSRQADVAVTQIRSSRPVLMHIEAPAVQLEKALLDHPPVLIAAQLAMQQLPAGDEKEAAICSFDSPWWARKFKFYAKLKFLNSGGDGGTCDPQLIKSLNRMTSEQQAKAAGGGGGGGGKEEANALSEEGSLQREMLKDPRFGSPLLLRRPQRTKVCARLPLRLALLLAFSFSYWASLGQPSTIINGNDITADRVPCTSWTSLAARCGIPEGLPEVLQVEAGGV
uniref:Alpha-1,6-mannosyl-glycoprotein 6-beta-N-acetylglucosaminyltransferase n=1 Tax=Macrostomum lignano TaxID=282301 RepID=A0A1I8FG78_9PLAT